MLLDAEDGLTWAVLDETGLTIDLVRMAHATSAWYGSAIHFYQASRQYGASKRLYERLVDKAARQNVKIFSYRTFRRLIRAGHLISQWDLEREHVLGLRLRTFVEIVKEFGDDDDRPDVIKRLRAEPLHTILS